MKRGIVVFAHNNTKTDYYQMAVATARRANRFLDLPVTIITDKDSVSDNDYCFDNTILIEPDKNNYIGKSTWINKGRYQVYDLTPYDETLVLDTDYMINSRQLLKTFDQSSDFVCYRTGKYMFDETPNERMSPATLDTYWATVMRFTKTQRTQDIFTMIAQVQHNYQHYAELHHFRSYMYRNDYALTIALRAVNGHQENKADFIVGQLTHVANPVTVKRIDDTTYRLNKEITVNEVSKTQYIEFKDFDFHMLNKDNFMELVK